MHSTKKWKNTADDEIEVLLNRGITKFELNNDHRIQIIAGFNLKKIYIYFKLINYIGGGRPNRQVEAGMYFWQIGSKKEKIRSGVALNDLFENSIEKLGWMRWEDGKWNVKNGLVKITQAQVFIFYLLLLI